MAFPISISVLVSTLEVASSKINRGGLHSITLAMVRSCLWPTEMFSASFFKTVSYPPGIVRIKKSALAALAAAIISRRVASGLL